MGSTSRSIQICVFYAASSITLSMVNKAVLSAYEFRVPFFLLAAQLALAGITCSILQKSGTTGALAVPKFDWNVYKQAAPVSLIFVANVSVGFFGLSMTDVPMFLAIRRTTTLFVMAMEFVVLGKVAGWNTINACILIAVGAIVAGWESLNSGWVGYACVLGNNVLTATYLTKMKSFSSAANVKGFGQLYYNTITALPLTIALSLFSGEWDKIQSFPYLWTPGFLFGLFVSSALGVVLTYAIVLCATVNSPLATSVTGNVKDVVTTVLGGYLFGGFHATFMSVTGILISFAGSGWYSVDKVMSAMATKAAKSDNVAVPSRSHGVDATEGKAPAWNKDRRHASV
jgi:solute carrier family 35 protein